MLLCQRKKSTQNNINGVKNLLPIYVFIHKYMIDVNEVLEIGQLF